MDFLKKDTFYLGAIVGIVLPFSLYALLYVVDMIFANTFGRSLVSQADYLYLLAVIANLFALRYFFSRTKQEKAGAGVLLVTIVIVVLYFFNYYQPS